MQDSKSGRFMVRTRQQQCFLPYYNIFLSLKAKGSLQGMVPMSPESPYQVLMITQSPVSFEFRPSFFFFLSHCLILAHVEIYLHPVTFTWVFPDVFQKYITGVFFSPYEEILCYLHTWGFHQIVILLLH